jgi:hypothetical protein
VTVVGVFSPYIYTYVRDFRLNDSPLEDILVAYRIINVDLKVLSSYLNQYGPSPRQYGPSPRQNNISAAGVRYFVVFNVLNK